MPIIRITKEQIDKAWKARKAALKKDREFKEFEAEQERLRKEAEQQRQEPEKEVT